MLSIVEDKYEDFESQYLIINSPNIILLNSNEDFNSFKKKYIKYYKIYKHMMKQDKYFKFL